MKNLILTLCIMCCLLSSNITYAEQRSCYLLIETSAHFDPTVVENTTLSVINAYVDKIELPPLSGIKTGDCTYNVSLSGGEDGYFISLSGPRINSIGSSELKGMRGFTQALLRSVHKTFTQEEQKLKICREYQKELAADCEVVESLIYLYDADGNKINDGQTVTAGDQFFVMIKPLTPLYAYVISKDSKDNLFQIFPNHQVTDIPNPLNANFKYFLPPQNSDLIFEFDHVTGTEKLYFVFSAVPLLEMNAYFETNQTPTAKDFEERVLTRGISLGKKKKTTKIRLPNKTLKVRNVEELKGKGVIVKEISLNHI